MFTFLKTSLQAEFDWLSGMLFKNLSFSACTLSSSDFNQGSFVSTFSDWESQFSIAYSVVCTLGLWVWLSQLKWKRKVIFKMLIKANCVIFLGKRFNSHSDLWNMICYCEPKPALLLKKLVATGRHVFGSMDRLASIDGNGMSIFV